MKYGEKEKLKDMSLENGSNTITLISIETLRDIRDIKEYNMDKRRYNSKDFNNNGVSKNEVIVDMNDIKGMFREWMMMKIDEDLEDMVKSYFDKEIIGDNTNQNKTKTMNDILTKKEVSQFLKCSIGMVDKLMSNNLPYYKIGRNVKFKREEIIDYLEERKVV
jgi:excisionase family DNA binding protein